MAAARAIRQEIVVVEAGSDGEFDAAFAALAQRRVGALVVAADQFFTVWAGTPKGLINLNTAKALGLEIPDKLLARADEVIE